MRLNLTVNGQKTEWQAAPADTLLEVLRREGFFGAKYGGCEKGECGACAILLDGRPVNSCGLLAAQADGHSIDTIEALGEHPEQGWKKTGGLHLIQQAFIETGAIQCGYCTPAMILAARSLIVKNPNPSEAQVRDAISGVLCRCTGYEKPVQAILRAAAQMRGEIVPPIESSQPPTPANWPAVSEPAKEGAEATMLFAPVLQTSQEQQITELRVLTTGKKDSRYTLPDSCVGAILEGGNIYAVSNDTVYRAELNAQRFSALKLPLSQPVTGFVGKLGNGDMLVSSGVEVFLVSLP